MSDMDDIKDDGAARPLEADPAHDARLACLADLKREPNDPTALTQLAEFELAAGNMERVIALLTRVRDLQPTDVSRYHDLGMMLAQVGRLDEAGVELARGLLLGPDNLLLRLHMGMVDMANGRQLRAFGHYLLALDQARNKPQPPLTRTLLDQAAQAVTSEQRLRISACLSGIRKSHGSAALRRIDECAAGFIGARRNRYAHPKWRPDVMYIPDLPPKPFYEREDFEWIGVLEAATPIIRKEMIGLLESSGPAFEPYIQLDPDDPAADSWGGLNRSMQWSTSHLFRHGKPYPANLDKCPRTRELLDDLPLMRIPGHGPEVVFSQLKPGAHIPPHYGSVNGRLIVHLPLIVPPDCGALRAAGESRKWVEGRCVIFDDSFEHDAWNSSKLTRVVMLLDIWNPNLTSVERDGFSALLVAMDEFGDAARAEASQITTSAVDST